MIYTLEIPGWQPTPLNRLVHSHWGSAARMKAADRDVIARACLAYGVRAADRKRRVSLHVVLPKGQRACDPDALWKSSLDALVACGALKNDSAEWVELMGQPRFSRGTALVTYVTLEDVL